MFFNNIAMVSGPTPPGTGVSAPAMASTDGWTSPMSALLLEHFHGAATRVGASQTAFPHRNVGYNFLTVAEWVDASATAANGRLGRDATCKGAPEPRARGRLQAWFMPIGNLWIPQRVLS